MKSFVVYLGLVAGCVMPFFNIPMIIHIIKRKSSRDISLTWVFGIWGCIVLMFPSAVISQDIVFKTFGILNLLLFSAVVVVTCKYRS